MPHLVVDSGPYEPSAHHKHPHEHPHEHPHTPHHHKNRKHPSPPKKHEKHDSGNGKNSSKESVKKQEPKVIKTAMYSIPVSPVKPDNKKVAAPSVLLCNIPMLVGLNFCCGDSCTAATTIARADSDQSTLSDDNKSQENGEPKKTKEIPVSSWEKFMADFNDNLCGKVIGGLPPTIDIATPSSAQQQKDKEELLATRSLVDVDTVEALPESKAPLELESEEAVTTVNETIVIYFSGSDKLSDTSPDADQAGIETVDTSEEPEEVEDEETTEYVRETKVMVVLDPVAEETVSDPLKEGYTTPCLSAVEGENNTAAPLSPVRFQVMGTGSFNEVPSSSQAEPAPAQEVKEVEGEPELLRELAFVSEPKENAAETESEKVEEPVNEDPAPPAPQAEEKVEPETVDHAAKPEEAEPVPEIKEDQLVAQAEEAAEPVIPTEQVKQIEDSSPANETVEEKNEEDLPSGKAPVDDIIKNDAEDKAVAIIKADKLLALKCCAELSLEPSMPSEEKGVKMMSLFSGAF